MHDIFFSYSSQDSKPVAKLVAALTEQRGWSIWWDDQLRAGSRYTNEIKQALAESRCVVVAWSANSIESDWVRSEADQGRKRGILAPISLDGTQPPMPFDQTETTDFSAWNGARRAPELLRLIEAVQRVLATGTAPGTEELLQREQRQAAIRRRRKLRIAALAAVVLIIVGASVSGYRFYTAEQELIRASDRLARESGAALASAQARETEEERKRIWWYLLFDSPTWKRLEDITLSLLLGIEAVRVAPTETARDALRNALAVSPFSDWAYAEDDDWANGFALDFSHDAKLLAIGGSFSGTLVWDFRAGQVLARIGHGINPVNGWVDKFGDKRYSRGHRIADFSPVDYKLATAEIDGSVGLWDGSSGKALWRGQHDEAVVAVGFSPDGSILASASYDGTARLWNVNSGEQTARLAHGGVVERFGFSPAGDLIATACRDGRARVWRVADGELLAELEVEGKPEGVRFDPTGERLLVFGTDIETGLWDWRARKPIWTLPVASGRDAGGIVSPDGERIVVGGANGELSWWNLARQEMLFSKQTGQYISSLRASADRSRIVTVDTLDVVQVWDVNSGRELKRMPYARWVQGGAISEDGELLASGGQEDGREYSNITEVTRIWPEDPIAAACKKVARNFTRNEWHRYFTGQAYRLTCPELGEPELRS